MKILLMVIIKMEIVMGLVTRVMEIFVFEVFGTTPEGNNADDNAHNEDRVEYDDDNDLCFGGLWNYSWRI